MRESYKHEGEAGLSMRERAKHERELSMRDSYMHERERAKHEREGS